MRDLAVINRQENCSLAAILCPLSDAVMGGTGHNLRVCWIGMHIGSEVGLASHELWELYYVLLLKDISGGVHQNPLLESVQKNPHFQWQGLGIDRLVDALRVMVRRGRQKGDHTDNSDLLAHAIDHKDLCNDQSCTISGQWGLAFAQQLGFSDRVIKGLHHIDEHWDGCGTPEGLSGDTIPLFSRIALLARIVDIFHASGGRNKARQEALTRSGDWFDPKLVSQFMRVSKKVIFWDGLSNDQLVERIIALEPKKHRTTIGDLMIHRVARAFGLLADEHLRMAQGHSLRVAHYVELMADYLGFDERRKSALEHAALLHDLGKEPTHNLTNENLGNDQNSLEDVKIHVLAKYTHFSPSAFLADPSVPENISLDMQIIRVADFFDSLLMGEGTKPVLCVKEALQYIEAEVGDCVEARCVAALQAVIGPLETFYDRFDPQKLADETKCNQTLAVFSASR